ncbi:MAG TPA: membrane protein insertase YidC, partial [Dyadobacter sp.]|nr:membrane protein insertase YidC [Dyadobacter sp.]
MDKNFVIGLVLIMLMLIGYQVLVPKPVEPTPVAEVKKEAAKPASVTSDTTQNSSQSVDSTVAPQKDLVIETKDTRVVFTNKGGVMKEVMLKNYKTYDQKPLYLIAENHNNFQIDLPTQTGDVRLTNQTFTTDAQDRTLAEKDSAVITYRATLKNNQTVEQTYVVRGSGYVIDYGIRASGALPANKSVEFHWDNDLLQLENDMKKNREVVTVNYYTDELKSL